MTQLASHPGFPRQIAEGVFWLNQCMGAKIGDADYHLHLSIYLLVGKDKTLLVDTSTPTLWPQISIQLEKALGGRTLDYLFVTHPEVPHSSALPKYVETFPAVKIVGDMRDYHVYYPEFAANLHHHVAGDSIDLGGMNLTFVTAHIKDLPSTLWAYESSRQVMFVCDGFSFTHSSREALDPNGVVKGVASQLAADDDGDDPVHLPGECALLSSEIPGELRVEQASYILRRALYWSRFVNADKLFDDVDRMLRQYPTRFIAPSHGNVIDDLASVDPILRASHVQAYQTGMTGKVG